MPDLDPLATPSDAGGARRSDGTAERRRAVRQAVSVAVATGLYGVSFGALAVAAGLSVLQTQALSVLMFTGGSQFAFIGVVGAGGGGLAAAATAALLGARNALYGAVVAPLLERPAAAPARRRTSPSTSPRRSPPPSATRASRTGFWWTGLGVFALWNVFTLVGAVVGDALGDPSRWGLDAAAAAAFLGCCGPAWPRAAPSSSRPARSSSRWP